MRTIVKLRVNIFAAVLITLTAAILVSAVLREFKSETVDPVIESTEAPVTSESVGTTEAPPPTVEDGYYFTREGTQTHVIGIRPIPKAAFPQNFRFSEYGDEAYKALSFYEVAVLELSDNGTSTPEIVISASPRHLIHERTGNSLEQIYRQMSIHYEDGFAVYSHNQETYVTSLTEPTLRRTFTLYGGSIALNPTDDSNTIMVFESTSYLQTFDVTTLRFNTVFKPQDDPMSNPFDWSSKKITHLAADPSSQGPSLAKITAEPRLKKITLGGSTDKLFAALGNPMKKGWLMGDYLVYEDLLVYATVDEGVEEIALYPVVAITYFGDHTIAGVKKGMTFAEVEHILGVPTGIMLSGSNELAYPLMLGYKKDGFHINVAFNQAFEISNFMIRLDEDNGDMPFVPYAPYSDGNAYKFTPEMLSFEGLGGIEDFISVYNACYFNASGGFYRYDFTSASPVLLSRSPMRAAFEIQFDANPSIVAVDQLDGIIYKIDLNTFERTPVSGPNYLDYYVMSDLGEGVIIKQTHLDDATLLDRYGLEASELVGSFEVSVPKDWHVKQGDYPEGLYWQIADLISGDAGFSLKPLKGQKASAYVYRLKEDILSQEINSSYKYPANAVILRKDGKIAGAWLMFNINTVGPSLNMRYLEDITGTDFIKWVGDSGSIVSTTSYAPSPSEAITAYFNAIGKREKEWAYAQLSPNAMLSALTTNHDPSSQLYHSGYNQDNSHVENIDLAKNVVIIRFYDPQTMNGITDDASTFNKMPIGSRISAEIELEISYKDPAFNLDQTRRPLFAGLTKTLYGWKIDGFGTGP